MLELGFLGLVALFSTFIVTVGVLLIIYARWHYGTLESQGFPVEKPHWFLGSYYNYTKVYHHWEDVRRAKELGPIYGVYSGRTPEIHVTDLQMIRRILSQDSSYFYDKKEVKLGHPTYDEIIEMQNGEKWKIERSILSPLFTSMKLKSLSEPLQKLCEEYVSVLRQDVENNSGRLKIEIKQFLPPFAIEVIAECLCGIKLTDARSPTNTFVTSMRKVMWEDLDFGWAFNILQVFPFIMRFLPMMPVDGLDFFNSAIKGILDQREESGLQIPDTVNALLEMRKKLDTEEWKKIGMNLNSVYGQAFEFFVASYSGLQSTITYLFYHLAVNPEVAKKVTEEVDENLKQSKGVIDYDTLSKFPYLTACFYETYRMTTLFFKLERVCTKDWEYQGYKIKKGSSVVIPMYPIHQNPDIYPEPEKFNPERFMPENKDKLDPCSLLTFGYGHRQCLGTKYVAELLKSFMVRVLRDFKIEKRSDTIWKEYPGNHLILRLDPLYVDLVRR